ncbi:MAG TPA: oligosaccharide flippase family protein, partial [Pseudomonadales bacterium]|nr:oligosaccharide flippase family protein [Pseudomonadales bacterium]
MVTLTTILASLHRALAWRPGGYLRASGALFGWLAVRTLAQTVLFILVARTLGAKGYGELVSVMALAGVFSFAVMGVSAVLVREGARDPLRLPQLVADMVRLWLFYMPVLCALAFGISLLLLGDLVPISAAAAIIMAEVVCATAVDGIGRIYQSQDRLAMMGLVSSGLMLIRLATFVVLSPFLHWTVTTWAFGYLAGSAGYLGILILMMNRSSLRIKGESIAHTAKASLPFSFSYAAQKIQAEINKPLLARINDVSGAGTLSAAQRFTDLLLLPILA